MAGHRSDMMKLVKLAKKNGCTVERTGSGHWSFTTPNGTRIIASFSPSTQHALRSTIRDLRKAGAPL